MVEALKKIDKKILIIAGVILLLPILLIIFLAIVQGCSDTKITHDKYEEKMITAAKEYFEENNKLPKQESEIKTVKLSTLVKKEYIKSTEDLLNDDTCEGSVSVRKNGSKVTEDNDGYLNYIVNLECEEYKTKTLINNIMDDLTTSGSGVYEDNGYYVYKGEEVNNYIKFFNQNYRILNMSSTGIVKLIKTESQSSDRYWDNKYNVDTTSASGKNIYADSAILKNIYDDYNNEKIISNSARQHIVSTDVCIDSRDFNNGTIGNYSCNNKLENQVVSLIDVSDFTKASLDPDCNSIYSRACNNYNYLRQLRLSTWTPTAVSNNTYQVFYLSSGIIKSQDASKYQKYNLVIHIDGDEKIVSGKGTESEPYVIE